MACPRSRCSSKQSIKIAVAHHSYLARLTRRTAPRLLCIPHKQRTRRPVGDATRQCLAQNGALPHHINRVDSLPSTSVVPLAAKACQGSPDEDSLNSVNKLLFLSFTAATHSSRSGPVVRQAKGSTHFEACILHLSISALTAGQGLWRVHQRKSTGV